MNSPLDKIKDKIFKLVAPPQDLEIWEWGEKNFSVPSDAANPGPWKVSRTGVWQRFLQNGAKTKYNMLII